MTLDKTILLVLFNKELALFLFKLSKFLVKITLILTAISTEMKLKKKVHLEALSMFQNFQNNTQIVKGT